MACFRFIDGPNKTDRHEIKYDGGDQWDQESAGQSLRIKYEGHGFDVLSITGRNDFEMRSASDIDMTPASFGDFNCMYEDAILSQELLVISATIYIFFSLGMQPIENSLVAKYTPGKWRSTGYGIKFILVFGVGSLAVYGVGWIQETWSLGAVYFFAGGLVALLVFFIAILIRVSRGTTCRNRR